MSIIDILCHWPKLKKRYIHRPIKFLSIKKGEENFLRLISQPVKAKTLVNRPDQKTFRLSVVGLEFFRCQMRIIIQKFIERLVFPHPFDIEIVELPVIQADNNRAGYERRNEIQRRFGRTVGVAVNEHYSQVVDAVFGNSLVV